MASVAIVGGGLLGSLTALGAAARGWDVDVFEARAEILSGASAANEGKIHLGLTYALGNSNTHNLMLRGAMSFSPLLEEALGHEIDWAQISTTRFDYIVMPGSLVYASDLSRHYSSMNVGFENSVNRLGSRYLGREISHLVDPVARKDPATGFPVFETMERAVDPLAVADLVRSAVNSAANIRRRLLHRVDALIPANGAVDVCFDLTGAGQSRERYDFAVNCAWESQLKLAPSFQLTEHNFRLKAAVRVPPIDGGRNVTLVQGPFGDVVSHRDYTYVSWYPSGRLTNEFGRAPSPATMQLLEKITLPEPEDADSTVWRESLATSQVAALQQLEILPDGIEQAELVAGLVIGHGRSDIDEASSLLHSRAEFGVHNHDGVIVPLNFKLTTAPLAANKAIAAIESAITRTVMA